LPTRQDNDRVMPIFLSGDVSHEIRLVPASDDGTRVVFEVSVMSGRFSSIDMRFQYREIQGGSWTEASIGVADGMVDGSVVRGMSCSADGSSQRVTWMYSSDGLQRGCEVDFRAVVEPSAILRSECRGVGWEETLSGSFKIPGNWSYGIQAGRDSRGYQMILLDRSFQLQKPTGEVLFSVDGLWHPKIAQETNNGYIILDTGNHSIIEVDLTGNITKTYNGASEGTLNWPTGMYFDSVTSNLLVTGGTIGRVYEMTWDEGNWGEILWQRGGFYLPDGVCYGTSGQDVIVVADKGNERIAVLTRAWPSTSVSYFSIATIASEALDLNLNSPSKVTMTQGTLLIAGFRGIIRQFSEDQENHPSLARAKQIESAAGTSPAFPTLGSGASSENTLRQYQNLIFAPMLRAKE